METKNIGEIDVLYEKSDLGILKKIEVIFIFSTHSNNIIILLKRIKNTMKH